MNAKNFKEVTRQVAVIKTQNRTLAIYANLRPVSIESGEDFMTIIDGKFKLDLNDFSNGKGETQNTSSLIWILKILNIFMQERKCLICPCLIILLKIIPCQRLL